MGGLTITRPRVLQYRVLQRIPSASGPRPPDGPGRAWEPRQPLGWTGPETVRSILVHSLLNPPGAYARVSSPSPHVRIAVYTGSFDPITLGHLDVIQRASRIFDAIVVGVGINPEKQPIFSLAERVELVQASIAGLLNVRVELFSGLSVAFVREQGAHVLLRGVRSLTDIDAEFTMTLANRKLDPDVETVFLMADAQYSHVSSSLLKQITPLADDEALMKFVPRPVVAPLRRMLSGPVS